MASAAVEAGFGEGLFRAQAELGADNAKGLACGHVRRMHLLVVEKGVVHGVQPVRQEDAFGQDGAVGFGVVEVGNVLVPRGFPTGLQLALLAPGALEVGLGDPTRVLVVLPVERRHLVDRGVGHQADVQEVHATQARVVRTPDVGRPLVVAFAKAFLKPEKHVPPSGVVGAFFHPQGVRRKPVQGAAYPGFRSRGGVPSVAHAFVGVHASEPSPAFLGTVFGFQRPGQAAAVAVPGAGHDGVGRGVFRPVLGAVGLACHEGLSVVPTEVGAQGPRRGAVVQAGVGVVVVSGAVRGLKLAADPFQLVLFQDDVEDAGRAVGVKAG